MKKAWIILWFLWVLIIVPAMGQGDKKTDPPKEMPAVDVKADPEFAKQFEDYLALSRVIAQIEQENGLPKMRERQNAMVAKLKEWMKKHNVEGWEYNEGTQSFNPKGKPKEQPKEPKEPK